jgi:glycosyltransferase involved in cell wall biosynthesis
VTDTSNDRPLCIGLYSPELPESGVSNGIVTYVGILRDALRQLGHSVLVVTAQEIELPSGQVERISHGNPMLAGVRSRWEALHGRDGMHPWARVCLLDAFRAARKAGAQVFEIEESFGWARRLTTSGLPIVQRLHGPHVFGREPVETEQQRRLGDLREKAELASFREQRVITSPSRRLLDALVARYDLSIPIARVIPNPVRLASRPDTWSLNRAVEDQILCVGRFDLRKGADIVIRAFAEALQERPQLSLVIAGPDRGLVQPNGQVLHFEEFVNSEISPVARARIRYLGPQSPDSISRLRRESTLALIGSRFETFSYVAAEAMAVGMPVLASDVYGPGEIIRDGIDGRIFASGNVNACARSIVEMMLDRPRLAKMGRSAYQRAAECLSPQRVARDTVAVYKEALALA